MARELVDHAICEINAPSVGSKELTTVMSLHVTANDPKTAVKTMNRNRRAIGYTRGVATFTVDMEVALLAASPEVDWEALQRAGEVFMMTYERNEDGERRVCEDCIVDDVDTTYTESGETRMTVKVLALNERAE